MPSLIEFKDERGLSDWEEASCKNFPQSTVGAGMKGERERACVCSWGMRASEGWCTLPLAASHTSTAGRNRGSPRSGWANPALHFVRESLRCILSRFVLFPCPPPATKPSSATLKVRPRLLGSCCKGQGFQSNGQKQHNPATKVFYKTTFSWPTWNPLSDSMATQGKKVCLSAWAQLAFLSEA